MLRVTALIPTYNRAAMLAECLESIRTQTRPLDQVIVIDDGSTDQTRHVVRRFEGTTYFFQPNAGKPSALNSCISRIEGDLVWIFDDDDVALPTSVERRVSLIASTGADLVLSRHYWGHSGEDGRIVVDEEATWPQMNAAEARLLLMQSCFTTMQGAMIRAAALRAAGPFREELRASEDYDMLLRLAREGRLALLDEPTFVFRRHEGMRGQAGHRYSAAEREFRFAKHDRMVGEWMRGEFALGEYLSPPIDGSLEGPLLWQAIINRMRVMAGKGLVAGFLDDAFLVAQLGDESEVARDWILQQRAQLLRAVQFRYLMLEILSDPDSFLRLAERLRRGSTGRLLLRIFGSGLAGRSRWGADSLRDRVTLLGLAAKLSLMGLRARVNA